MHPQEATLVDEFGKHSTEDLMARLDSLHNQLYANEGSTALMRVYRGEKDYLGFPFRYLAVMKTYLTNHKVDEKRIALQECDGELDTQYKLYIVPAAATIPFCTNTVKIPTSTTLFDSYFYSHSYPEIDDCCTIPGSNFTGANASLRKLVSLLEKSPTSRAYVIAYSGTNIWWYNGKTLRPMDKLRSATSTAMGAKRFLVQNGIDPKRVIAINGGYRDKLRNVDLWFVPDSGTIPKPTPNYFPKTRKTKAKR
jgi:hypothetical protein